MATEAFPLDARLAAVPARAEDTPTVELCNCTPSRLSVQMRRGRLTIPPLGRATIDLRAFDPDALRPAVDAGVLAIKRCAPPEGLAAAWATLVAMMITLGVFLVGILDTNSDAKLALIAGTIAAAFGIAVWKIDQLAFVRRAVTQFPARVRELMVLSMAIVIVFALPGAILYFGSDVPGLWRAAQAANGHDAAVALIGIGVQFCCIVGASALPVVLYFIFDRERMRTLRQRVTRYIFRLDPGVRTLADIDAKYGQWLDEAFGRRDSEARYLPGTRWPIVIATSVITLGWAVALLDTKPEGAGTLTALIQPTPAAPTFAFLGAYFFTLNSVLRGFVRGDLRPKTYAQIATRIVGSVVLAFALERLIRGVGGDPSSATLLAFAFLIGIVPETFLIRLQETARGFVGTPEGKAAVDAASHTYESEPLTRLQGIDIYDRARLLDEGVTNVEGLAHHDLVELLLKTRIPAARLVDWVDQAILFIHCANTGEEAGKPAQSALTQLRGHGIRTATELRRAYEAATNQAAFAKIVTTPKGKPPIIPVVLHAIAKEDWIDALEHWHGECRVPRTLRVPESVAA
jgi:hypothetical protein